MANVLMGWEMGGGFGHVVPLLAVARRLRDHGHRPYLVLRDVVTPAAQIQQDGFPILQAPIWMAPTNPALRLGAVSGFADVLASTGFGNVDSIEAIIGSWDHLINLVRPRLIVAEYSVGLCVAARGRVPTVAMGTGFALPPAHLETFPPLRPKVKTLIPQEDLLSAINSVQRKRAAPLLPRLPAIFDAEGQFVYVLPMLDPYADSRAQPADGPLEPPPAPAPPAREPHVFVYMGVEHPAHRTLLEALGRAGLPATVYLRGAADELRRELERPGLHMLDAPTRLDDMLPRCTLVVHYGALGTAVACLGTGRPQVVLPRYVERLMVAEALAEQGVARTILPEASADDMTAALLDAAGSPDLVARAAAVAADIAAAPHGDVLSRIVERCLALIDETQ